MSRLLWWWGRGRGEVIRRRAVEKQYQREAEGRGAGDASEAGGEEVRFGVGGGFVVCGEEGGEEGGGVGY